MNPIREYITELQETLDRLPIGLIEEVITILHEARLNNRKVFVMGNGGSASTASHFACDLAKNSSNLSLLCSASVRMSYANDEGYENVFVQQLANFVQPKDVVIGISTSGNSLNVIKAIQLANEVGATTVAFTGFDSGQLGPLVDLEIHVRSDFIEQVEDIHLMLEHLICTALRRQIEQEVTPELSTAASQEPLG